MSVFAIYLIGFVIFLIYLIIDVRYAITPLGEFLNEDCIEDVDLGLRTTAISVIWPLVLVVVFISLMASGMGKMIRKKS